MKAQRKKPSYPAKLIERRRRVVSRTGGRFGLDALNARKPKKKEMDRGRVEGKMKGEGKERRCVRRTFGAKEVGTQYSNIDSAGYRLALLPPRRTSMGYGPTASVWAGLI